MALYTFESRSGEVIEREFPIGKFPSKIKVNGRTFKKVLSRSSTCVPDQHKASTYAGRDGDRKVARQYRQNKQIAEGLANGTMTPPDDRPICGESQPREFKAQFNQMYEDAKRA